MKRKVWQVTLREGKWYIFCGNDVRGPFPREEVFEICVRWNRGEG